LWAAFGLSLLAAHRTRHLGLRHALNPGRNPGNQSAAAPAGPPKNQYKRKFNPSGVAANHPHLLLLFNPYGIEKRRKTMPGRLPNPNPQLINS